MGPVTHRSTRCGIQSICGRIIVIINNNSVIVWFCRRLWNKLQHVWLACIQIFIGFCFISYKACLSFTAVIFMEEASMQAYLLKIFMLHVSCLLCRLWHMCCSRHLCGFVFWNSKCEAAHIVMSSTLLPATHCPANFISSLLQHTCVCIVKQS